MDPVLIPQGVSNGERVAFEGFAREPEAQINPKKKIFEQIAPDLRTNAGVRHRGIARVLALRHVCSMVPHGAWCHSTASRITCTCLPPQRTTYTEGVVVYKGVPCMTSKGPVTASIPNGSVA